MNHLITNNTNNLISRFDRSLVALCGETVSADVFGQSWKNVLAAFVAGLQQKEMTKKAYAKALVPFFKWTESYGKPFNMMVAEDLLSYKDYLSADGTARQPRTISLYMCALRLFYSWYNTKTGYPNIAAGLKGPRKFRHSKDGFKKQALTNEQAVMLLSSVRRYVPARRDAKRRLGFRHSDELILRNYSMINLMLRCGLRTVEVSRLRVMNIAYREGYRVLYVWGKGHDRPGVGQQPDDYVRLTDAAYQPIADYLHARGAVSQSAPLFAAVGYGREGESLSPRMVQMICKEGLRNIGLDEPGFTAHSLRHTTGEMLINQGASLLDAQNAMRHQSPNTTEIYIEQAMEKRKLEHPAEALLDDCFNSSFASKKW